MYYVTVFLILKHFKAVEGKNKDWRCVRQFLPLVMSWGNFAACLDVPCFMCHVACSDTPWPPSKEAFSVFLEFPWHFYSRQASFPSYLFVRWPAPKLLTRAVVVIAHFGFLGRTLTVLPSVLGSCAFARPYHNAASTGDVAWRPLRPLLPLAVHCGEIGCILFWYIATPVAICIHREWKNYVKKSNYSYKKEKEKKADAMLEHTGSVRWSKGSTWKANKW